MKKLLFVCLRNGIKYEIKGPTFAACHIFAVYQGITDDNRWLCIAST